ncbi:MAG: serine protease [Acholeplasma sp.]|nr:serine protease [Acholeplasma sp.]
MKKFFGYIRNIIVVLLLLYVTSIFVDIRIEGVPLKSIYETSAKETYKFIDSLVDRIKSEPEITEFSIKKTEDDLYQYEVKIKYVDVDELVSITIGNIVYDDFEITKDKSIITASFLETITFEEGISNKSYTISSIKYQRNDSEKSLNTNVVGYAFKSLDLDIVEDKKQSVVGIHACNSEGGFTICNSWGSGVIFKSESQTVESILGDYNLYTYYILTNAHVVEGGSIFDIYYKAAKLNDQATVVGTYTVNTDLAILELETRNVLEVLEDTQFDTKEALPVYKGQTVFSVGSPVGIQNFNKFLEGTIESLNHTVYLKKNPNNPDSVLCVDGCNSFSTTAALGQGSSGGAMFDTAGNIIGIHFAGDEDNTIGFEIYMETVLIAIDTILNQTADSSRIYIN